MSNCSGNTQRLMGRGAVSTIIALSLEFRVVIEGFLLLSYTQGGLYLDSSITFYLKQFGVKLKII